MDGFRKLKAALTNFLTVTVTHRASNDNRKLKGENMRRLKNEMHRISYRLKRDAEMRDLHKRSETLGRQQRDQNPGNPADGQPGEGQ